MNSDLARLKFEESGLQYSDIGSKEIALLQNALMVELGQFENKSFRMALKPLRKKDIDFEPDGSVKKCHFRVKGWLGIDSPYFTDREAISFNQGDFIGFSGWADNTNKIPFLSAFLKWVDLLKTSIKPAKTTEPCE